MSPRPSVKVAALVSIGRHPESLRSRRAAQDARAVELGLRLAGPDVNLIHAGQPEDQTLRQYLGMGIPQMTVLQAAPEEDAVPVLAAYLEKEPLDIVLTGVHAEHGEGSGMLPYMLAERLGWPLVSRVAEVKHVTDGVAELLQALPRGQRRALRVPLPFVATVDNAAHKPRQYAFGPGNRAAMTMEPTNAAADEERLTWQESPAKPRPKRLKVVKAKSAADRFKAATAKSQGQGGRVIQEGSDREKAEILMELLISEGLVH